MTPSENLFNFFDEVRTEYYDEYDHYTAVDAWFHNDDDGIVAARVYDNGEIESEHPEYLKYPQIIMAIAEILNSIKDE